MSQPQLTPAQFEHMVSNLEKRVDAKILEISGLSQLQNLAPHAIRSLLGQPAADQFGIADFFTSKLIVARIELEELELGLTAYKQILRQQQSGIIVPGVSPSSLKIS